MSLLNRVKKLEEITGINGSPVMMFVSIIDDNGKEIFTQGSIEEMYFCSCEGNGYRHLKIINGETVEKIVLPNHYLTVEQSLDITPEEAYELIL